MRRRLVLAIAGVAAAAIMLLAVPLALVLQRSYRDEDLLRLQRDTVAASRAIDISGQRRDPIEVPSMDAVVGVYDRSGRRLAGAGPAAAPEVARQVVRAGQPADSTGGDLLVVAVPVLDGERVGGVLRAARRDSDAPRETRNAWLVLGGIGAAIIATAAAAALVLGRRLATPLERLTVAARRLGHGDFSVRAGRAGVTEVDAVAAALDATAQRLGDLVERERTFTTAASHQLRTPLAALRLELEALELRDRGAPELAAALAQVDRLETTIDTLLSVARDTRHGDERVDLSELVGAAASRWRGVLAADARPLRTPSGPRPAVARASEQVVDEIVDILVDNAHRHGAGAVTVGVRRVDAWLVLDVADEGSGFAGDGQAGTNGGDGEHGIGLNLARSLAHAEGGRLLVPSTGARPVVTLMLPAADRGE